MASIERNVNKVSAILLILGSIQLHSVATFPATDCTNRPADVVFILDTSNSIWLKDFAKQMAFVSGVVDKFDIGPGRWQTRVGVLTFGHDVWRQFDLNEHMDKEDLKTSVTSIKHGRGRRTNTGAAIRFAVNNMFTFEAGHRPGISKVAIVVTDGRSQRPWETTSAARFAHDADIRMFAIGVGRRLDFLELSAIASDPDKDYLFSVDDFNALSSITDSLARKTCDVTVVPEPTTTPVPTTTTPEPTSAKPADQPTETCTSKPADIFFVVDASGSITPKDFGKEIDFVRDVVSAFDLSSGNTRVGVLSFSFASNLHFGLDNNMDKDELLEQIGSIRHLGGGTNTADALRKVRQSGFTKVARPNVPKIVIVLTDGQSTDGEQTVREAKITHMQGITVFAVGIGTGVDLVELKTIASDPDENFVFQVDDFSSLDTIKDILAIKTCGVRPSDINEPKHKPACEVRKNTDLMFVYDANALGIRKTHDLSQFIATIVSKVDLNTGYLQVGRLTDNCPSGGNFALNNKLSPADFSQVTMPSLFRLIQRVKRVGFSADYGAKAGSSKLAVLFIDSEMAGVDHAALREVIAMSDSAEVFVVAIGNGPMIDTFSRNIKSTNFVRVESYKHFDLAETKLLEKLCDFFAFDFLDYDIGYVVPV